MRIVWTAGSVEPDDKWMMVTIIHLSVAPNLWVGPQTDAPKAVFDTFIFEGGGGGGSGVQKSLTTTDPINENTLNGSKIVE